MSKYKSWFPLKEKLNKSKNDIFFRERDIFFAHLGKNIGFEQDGKGDNCERPVVIVKKFGANTAFVIPLSSKIKTGKFYFSFLLNGKTPNVALLSQARIIDRKRLINKIGVLNKTDFDNLLDKTQKLLFSKGKVLPPDKQGGEPEGHLYTEHNKNLHYMSIFTHGTIVAYPTNTSFGLGVRADDVPSLEQLYKLKQRPTNKYSSLMVRDWDMLREFAIVPDDLPSNFFTERPRTAILQPTAKLPTSPFWPTDKVAFRISTIPEVATQITYPITATSANLSGQPSIFTATEIEQNFGSKVVIFPGFKTLEPKPASEIWDFTGEERVRIR